MASINDTIPAAAAARLRAEVARHPYPLVFATISGAHLYGFPSPDSDYDLRGVHLLPLEEVVGLKAGQETVEKSGVHDGLEIDLVTHDARKFFGLLLKKNGYVLEQLTSPLVVHTTPGHAELKEIAKGCIIHITTSVSRRRSGSSSRRRVPGGSSPCSTRCGCC